MEADASVLSVALIRTSYFPGRTCVSVSEQSDHAFKPDGLYSMFVVVPSIFSSPPDTFRRASLESDGRSSSFTFSVTITITGSDAGLLSVAFNRTLYSPGSASVLPSLQFFHSSEFDGLYSIFSFVPVIFSAPPDTLLKISSSVSSWPESFFVTVTVIGSEAASSSVSFIRTS